jgi:hypothetical protein
VARSSFAKELEQHRTAGRFQDDAVVEDDPDRVAVWL